LGQENSSKKSSDELQGLVLPQLTPLEKDSAGSESARVLPAAKKKERTIYQHADDSSSEWSDSTDESWSDSE